MAFSEPGVVFLNAGREEAEAYLANAVPGSYVVRPSSRPGNLSLTYRTREAVNRLGHLLLVREAAGWTTEGVPYHFPTVRELLLRLPYGLRLQDEQMYAAPANQRPAAPAAAGYAAVPTAAQMMNASPAGGYGRLPLKDDAAAAASAAAAATAAAFAAAAAPPVNTLNENNGYGRAPIIPNALAASGDYGRVPPNRANATGASDDYGRVPQANGGGAAAAAVSPYARLQPTSTLTRGPSGGNVLLGSAGGAGSGGGASGGGYGRVPQPDASEAPATNITSLPGYVTARGPESPVVGSSAGTVPRRMTGVAMATPIGVASATSSTASTSTPSSPLPARANAHVMRGSAAQRQQGRGIAQEYGAATAQSGTVNAPHQLAMQSLALMQGVVPLAGHERFLVQQLPLLARAKEKATSTPVYTALVALGTELTGLFNELVQLVQQPPAQLTEAIIANVAFQQHYIALQLQVRNLKTLLDVSGGGFSRAIQSELGSKFWAQHLGNNNAIPWSPFFQVLQALLGPDLAKAEPFVKFMFDCNKGNRITTQSFNMFIHWFDYESMSHPITIKEFLSALIARAEEVFFFEGFHGFVSREKAERILSKRPPKSYLIRLSDSSAGVFILSYVDSKQATRHRLLNQVDKQGFMVEQKTYKSLPELLVAHATVLAAPVANSLTFDPQESIYGGGENLYESLAVAAVPTIMAADVRYCARIVLTNHWMTVRLELRESDITISTIKAPLRRVISLVDIVDVSVVAVSALPAASSLSSIDMPPGAQCFRIVVSGGPGVAHSTFAFASDVAQQWVQAVATAAVEARRAHVSQNATERSVEERMLLDFASLRNDMTPELAQIILNAPRQRLGVLSPSDQIFLACVNDVLSRPFKKTKNARPPVVLFSKLDLDFGLNGSKCETMIPVRDSFKVSNNGGAPVEIRFDSFERLEVALKFVPTAITLEPGSSADIHVTISFNQTTSLRDLVRVSFGPGRGSAALVMSLVISSKMMEALNVDDIDFGPRLGAGAFGQVFHGTYKKTREVAIKVVGFEPDYEQELNILRELRAHANIVEYIGACKKKPFQGFIVLEFMSLGSLDKYIHDKSFVFSLQLAMRVSLDVATGLAHLHKSKIMHLDMKPANVLINSLSLSAHACVKLADFGLSQSRDSMESFRGEFVEGTLLYMAPEMLREKLFSFKGDIFSFGMTLWEMLARQQPYSGEKHRKLNKAQFEEIRERGELPGDLEVIEPMSVRELVTRLLSVDLEQRPTADMCIQMIKKVRQSLP